MLLYNAGLLADLCFIPDFKSCLHKPPLIAIRISLILR
jgi:hypothetical protein